MFKHALIVFSILAVFLFALLLDPERKGPKISAHMCWGCHSKSVSCHINPDVLKLKAMKGIKRLWENTIFHATERKDPFDHGSYFVGACLGCHPDL